jgi:hypothetical protein
MHTRRDRAKHAIRPLPADPPEEQPKLRRIPQGLQARVTASQIAIAKRRVDLPVTRLAEQDAVLRLPTFLPWPKVMLGQQRRRHLPPAKLAGGDIGIAPSLAVGLVTTPMHVAILLVATVRWTIGDGRWSGFVTSGMICAAMALHERHLCER